MLENLFRGLFDSDLVSVISVTDFLLCLGFSLVLGLVMAFAYMYRTRYTKSFVITLALLPAVVCVVIMLVNGNVGTGVAVAGAFSLVRVKSTNMGSMFKLTYNVMLRDVTREKEMIDKIRCRNGNLEITVSKQETVGTEL